MNKSKFFSFLAFRISLIIAAIFMIAAFAINGTIGNGGFGHNIQMVLIDGLIAFVVAYVILLMFVKHRLKTVSQIIKNIQRKQFDDYEELELKRKDELDYLIHQTIRASSVVELEIRRLNKIENYRKEFIGDISHELKTPIFAVQGFIETLLNGALEDPNVNRLFLEKAMRNANRLVLLTRDLMEISRLETGELKSNPQPVLLHDVLDEVIEGLQYKANKEKTAIKLEEFDTDLMVNVDRNQIKQVMINLIENAIKYNRDHNDVNISIEPHAKDPNRICMVVKDHGIGIDPKDLKRVTERFYRVDKSRSRKKGGTGLGLSIVKHIVEAHGEKLYIDSRVNEGSTFKITMTKVTES